MTNKKIQLTYYQTLTDVFRPLGLKNLTIDNKCQINEKKAKIVKNMLKFVVKILQNIPFNLEIIQ